MNFRILLSEVLHRGKVFNTRVDKIEYSSGNRAVREVAEHPGGAVVVPVTNAGKIKLSNNDEILVAKVLNIRYFELDES